MKKILVTLSLVFIFSMVATAQSNSRLANKGKAKRTQSVELENTLISSYAGKPNTKSQRGTSSSKRQAKVRKIRGYHGGAGGGGDDYPTESLSKQRKKRRTN